MTEEKNYEKEIRIFKNKFKGSPGDENYRETDPDYKALFTIDGKKYVAKLYNRKSKNDLNYLGGKIFEDTSSTPSPNNNIDKTSPPESIVPF